MRLLSDYLRGLYQATITGWDRFWFTPSDPATIGMIRVLAGAMLLYTHAVWTLDLEAFFGRDGWLQAEAVRQFHNSIVEDPGDPAQPSALAAPGDVPAGPAFAPPAGRDESNSDEPEVIGPPSPMGNAAPRTATAATSGTNWRARFIWSYFYWFDHGWLLWGAHAVALGVFLCFMLGLWSRVTSVLAFLATVSYIHRVPGAEFGLDHVNAMLALYLSLGPSGGAWSLDRWLARRRGQAAPVVASVGANLATRLIQLHMCVIYFFAGIGKLLGPAWWDGQAMWLAFANYEYQSLDMTWTAQWPLLVNFLTHATIVWEVSFCALVWPRWTRPLVVLVAVPLHLGIAACLGMPTFGIAMLFGCMSFVSPALVRSLVEALLASFRFRLTPADIAVGERA